MINLLFQEPILFFAAAVAIIFAISVHEFSHAAMAYYLGDPTARNEGRLTLNPLAHLDPWGTILLFIAGFGWGKPVPFNPYNLRNQRYGPALVSIAGPASNFAMVIVFSLLLKFVYPLFGLGAENALFQFLYFLIIIDAILMVFNLLPIPPLDGSKLLFAVLPRSLDNVKIFLQRYGFFILIALVLFGGFFFRGIFSLIINGIDWFLAV
jgi:Zn-dependent protease